MCRKNVLSHNTERNSCKITTPLTQVMLRLTQINLRKFAYLHTLKRYSVKQRNKAPTLTLQNGGASFQTPLHKKAATSSLPNEASQPA